MLGMQTALRGPVKFLLRDATALSRTVDTQQFASTSRNSGDDPSGT